MASLPPLKTQSFSQLASSFCDKEVQPKAAVRGLLKVGARRGYQSINAFLLLRSLLEMEIHFSSSGDQVIED